MPNAATAIVLQMGAFSSFGLGWINAGPQGSPIPSGVLMAYNNVAFINATSVTLKINPTNGQFSAFSNNNRTELYGDVLGYFAAPVATALSCIDTANNTVNDIPVNGTANAVAPTCPAGYTPTATNCETSSWLMPIVFFHAGTCSARNNDTSPQDLRASRTCCRVPGR